MHQTRDIGPEPKGRHSALPEGTLPRGLSHRQSAEYVGAGITLFDEMVGDGRMPRPKLMNTKKVWDRLALDEAFAALPDVGDDLDDVWSKVSK